MRRPAHGGTCRPGPSRPASGYGRPTGMPGPRPAVGDLIEPRRHDALPLALRVPEAVPADPVRTMGRRDPDGEGDAELDPAVG